MKAIVFSILTLGALVSASGSVRFYPAVVDERPNLLKDVRWNYQRFLKHAEFEDGVGGPRADSRTYRVVSRKAASAYAVSDNVKVVPGHTYLEGAWLRFGNAKVMVQASAYDTAVKEQFEPRIYVFSGFNSFLEPFFSDSTKRRLGGDPSAWKLIYRTMTYPLTVQANTAKMWMGLYLAEGDVTFADPFLIDVTDLVHRPLVVEVKGGKPVKALAVSETDTRDVVWSKRFEQPVTDFRETIEKVTDFLRGGNNNQQDAYQLDVEYDDGTHERLDSPLSGSFKERT